MEAEVLFHAGGIPVEHSLHHPDIAVHIQGVRLVQLIQLMLKALHNGVHGALDAAFGLAQVLTLHTGILKLGVRVQQLLGCGQVVVQEGIDTAALAGILLHRLEDLPCNLLQPVDLGGRRYRRWPGG